MRPTPVKLDQNDAFKRAVDLMNNTQTPLFITGKAGTGKSTLLDHFILNTTKKCVVLAPTGVAALNVKGQTIHRFFNFYIDVTPEKIKKKEIKPRNAKLLKVLETIIIDEISMVRADILDCIDTILRMYGRDASQPFGGVQMIFVGDLYQLPPVVSRDEGEIFETHYDSPYFFSARVMKDVAFDIIELEKVYRQKDLEFVELLNRVRNNGTTDEDIALLNTRVIGDSHALRYSLSPLPLKGEAGRGQNDLTIILTSTNAGADGVNDTALSQLPGRTYQSMAEISGDFTKEYYPTATDLKFKIGSQIMMLNNDSKKRWVNGSIGVVTDYTRDEDGNDVVRVRLNGERDTVDVQPFLWEVFKSKVVDGQIVSDAVGTFSQLPFRLAWAVTIHKSQGKTFDHVIVDIGRGTFATGQLYVALSRCTSFDGLHLKTPIKASHIRVDYRIPKFMTNFQYQKSAARVSVDDKFAVIDRAIRARTPIKITYLKPNDTKSSRVIDALSIGTEEYMGKPFTGLRAFCHERQDNRIFRVDRILEIETVDLPVIAKKKNKEG